mgnify:CR=1 FL=1
MVVDIAFPFEYASDGDIATVNGRDFYEQNALLLALETQITLRGTGLTANKIVEIEDELTDQFSQSPYFSNPSVTATALTDEELTLRVEIAEVESFDITAPTTQ